MQQQTKNNETDYAGFFIGIIIFLVSIPILISYSISLFVNNAFVWSKDRKNFKWILLLIVGITYFATLLVFLLMIVFEKPAPSNVVAWYDMIIPITSEVKIIIYAVKGNSISSLTPLYLIIAILNFSLILVSVNFAVTKFMISSFKTEMKAYESKLKNDEVYKDPRKYNGWVQSLFRTFYGLKGSKLENLYFERKKISNTNLKEHVMLDNTYGIPRELLNRHLAILGTTGSGKTETMYKFINDGIKNNKPVLFVDGKGGAENIAKTKALADKYNKKFYLFTISNRIVEYKGEKFKPQVYNPFDTDNEGILVDTIMALFNYTEEHYKAGARVYIDILVKTLLETKIKVSWESIMLYCDKAKLIERLKYRYGITANKQEDGDEVTITSQGASKEAKRAYSIDLTQINNIDERSIAGFVSRLGMFYNTTRETITDKGFTLKEVFHNNGVVLFSLNSLDYPEQSQSIGKLIVNNIKANAEENSRQNKHTLIALDEFNVFASNHIIDILNKTRSKGYEVILAFQSLSDLSKISEDFRNQVIENTNAKIIHATNDPVGAEFLAKVLGTKKNHKRTYQSNDQELSGAESIRVVDEFIAHPNEIKTLKTGECFAKYTDLNGEVVATPKIKIILNK